MGDESSPIPYDAKDQQQVELGVVAVVQAYVTWRLCVLDLEQKPADAHKFWQSVAKAVGEEGE